MVWKKEVNRENIVKKGKDIVLSERIEEQTKREKLDFGIDEIVKKGIDLVLSPEEIKETLREKTDFRLAVGTMFLNAKGKKIKATGGKSGRGVWK